MDFRDLLIDSRKTLEEALEQLDKTSKQILFVLDGKKLAGALSDGDVRRFILRDGDMKKSVICAANTNPRFLFDEERSRARTYLSEKRIEAVPIVNEFYEVIDIVLISEMVDASKIRLRELVPCDIGLVNAFFDQMAGDTRAMFNRGDCNRKRVGRYLNGESTNEKHFCAVCDTDKGEEMVGYVFMWDTDTAVPWIGIAVHESWKGYHLGRTLLNHLEFYAAENGYGGLMLTTVPANIRAQSLYTRMGFEFMGNHQSGEFFYIKRFAHRHGGV